jgi:molybdate transport system substrate-binding protein
MRTSHTRSIKGFGIFSAVLAALLLAGCGSGSSEESKQSEGRLTVFGAASLTDVLPEIDSTPRYSFASSDTLATQIREGADVDVFAAANTRVPNELFEADLVEEPVVFAVNRIVLAVPTDSKLQSLDDLVADKSALIVMARKGVPLGDYTVKVLDALERAPLVKRTRSFEEDARAVTSKVALGEADAGFVYVTDLQPFKDKLRAIELPETSANHAAYAVAAVRGAKHGAGAGSFIEALTSKAGRDALTRAGFAVPDTE